MKFLFDLFPVILFFIAFKFAGIYVATSVAIAATVVQIAWSKWRHGKIDTMLWVSFVIIAVFGGATLWLHDATFIKLKPTVLYWCFALVLLGAPLLFGKNLMRSMMSKQMHLPDAVWSRLNLAWGLFFMVMGAVNLYVAFTMPLAFWVNFKLFGFLGLMIAFVIAQSVYLSRYMKEAE